MNCRFTRAAERDIEEIYRYGLIQFGEMQADRYAQGMGECFDLICGNPGIGRLDTRITPAVRRFEFKSHVIFYDIEQDAIRIVRVLHGAADFVRHLNKS